MLLERLTFTSKFPYKHFELLTSVHKFTMNLDSKLQMQVFGMRILARQGSALQPKNST